MRGRNTTALLATAAGPLALAATAVAMELWRPATDGLLYGHVLGGAAMAVACGAIAALILGRLRRHPVGVTFAVLAWSNGLAALGSAWADATLGSHAVVTGAYWLAGWIWIPGVVLPLSVLPVVFPSGAKGRFQRLLVWSDLAAVAAFVLTQATRSRIFTVENVTEANPLRVPGADAAGTVVLTMLLGLVLASLAVLLVRLFRSPPALRRQIIPFVCAGVVVVAMVIAAGHLGHTGAVLQDLAMLLVPVSAAVCVLRLRLYDIEIVIRRAVVWTILSAGIVGTYVLCVQVASNLLHVRGQLASVVASGVIALAFGPARTLVQRGVARWLFGDRDDPYGALAGTTQALAASADPMGALRSAADDLALRLRCPGIRIVVDDAVVAGTNRADPASLIVPLRRGAETVAQLEVLGRSAGEEFSRADQRLLADIAAPLANAVAAVQLTDGLRRSREQEVRAREEERRRIRGELHDDIGPSLAALVVHAQVAIRRLERHDLPAAQEVLETLQGTAVAAIADVRRVIEALGPRALDDLGLPDAVRLLTASLAGDDLRVDLDLGALPDLPAAVEVGAYRVLAEALTNTQRHARASGVAVSMRVVDGCLELVVVDDGVGPGYGRRAAGMGMSSMRTRVEELGGSFQVAAVSPSGTRVVGRLPLDLGPGAVER